MILSRFLLLLTVTYLFMAGPYRDKHLIEVVKGSENSVLITGEYLKILYPHLLWKDIFIKSCFESSLWLTLKRFLLLEYTCIEYKLSQKCYYFFMLVISMLTIPSRPFQKDSGAYPWCKCARLFHRAVHCAKRQNWHVLQIYAHLPDQTQSHTLEKW